MSEAVAQPPSGGSARVASTILSATIVVMGVLWVLDIPQELGFAFYSEQLLAGVLGLSFAVIFFTVSYRGSSRVRPPSYDVVLGLLGLGTMLHVVFAYERLLIDVSQRTTETLVIGIIVVLLVLEGLRRTAGYTLLAVVLVFMAYALIADLVPGDLEGSPVEVKKLLLYLALDTNAVLGIPMKVGATVVLMFILMGQLLFASGGGQFFTDLAMATMGRRRGGAAKVAVVGSALFGSISGTAVSNVASTGVITIPLMRRSGYTPAQAGAIEAVASTGGQLMPPIMGASAFLIAEFLEISYTEVMIAALVPALLYYFAVFIQVDLVAARDRIAVVEAELPQLRDVLVQGWHFLIPFAVLLYALFELLAEPEVAALYAAAAIIVLGSFRGYGGRRLSPRNVLAGIANTGFVMIELFMILAAAGFVIGILNVTGLGFALTLFLVHLAGGSLIVLLLIAAVVCIILGMGMPTIGVYILLATLVAPAIVEAGVLDLAAHMFILYFGMMSMITPPIALAAFAAATIAHSRPMETGWTALRLGWVAYMIPFLFVYSPTLLLIGDWAEIALATVTASIGVYYITVAVVGHFARNLPLLQRVLLGAAGLASLVPSQKVTGLGGLIDLAGVLAGALLLGGEYRRSRRTRVAAAE